MGSKTAFRGFHSSRLGKIITVNTAACLQKRVGTQLVSQSVTQGGQMATAEPTVREGFLKRVSFDDQERASHIQVPCAKAVGR